MGWEQRIFKGKQTVWAKTNDAGELVVEDGRVPIKYNEAEDAKVYNANASNLKAGEAKKPKSGGAKTKADFAEFDEEIWDKPVGVLNVTKTPASETEYSAPDGEVWAYTDGACSGNPGPCASGLVIVTGDEVIDISQHLGLGTNNIGELFAIKLALDYSPAVSKLRVFTDSGYAIGVLDKNWKAKANKTLISAIKKARKERDGVTEFVKVKGHSGNPLNERADQLAVNANQTK